jgi:hypothetical protein
MFLVGESHVAVTFSCSDAHVQQIVLLHGRFCSRNAHPRHGKQQVLSHACGWTGLAGWLVFNCLGIHSVEFRSALNSMLVWTACTTMNVLLAEAAVSTS